MRIPIILVILINISACGTTVEKSNRPIREIITGSWAPETKVGQVCRESPPTYSFSNDGALMYVTSDSGLYMSEGGGKFNKLTYQIVGEGQYSLRTIIEGEERRTANGNVVMWDLVLLSENRFCWHRSDWDSNSCTQEFRRCNVTP